MHGNKAENQARLEALRDQIWQTGQNFEVAVCVPFPYLSQAEDALRMSSVAWGVQDISAQSQGAYTGEVSAAMAADFGCRFAVIGHSERRAFHGETSSAIAMKARRAVERNLTPILCVGETLEEREAGRTQQVISTQLNEVLDLLQLAEATQLVIAYEPVWAIGTGKSAKTGEAQDVHAHIRGLLRARDADLAATQLLYGGSVKATNAAGIFCEHDIDGALVGGASLDANEFAAISLAAGRAEHAEL
jgi:triosephosphate isomerase